MIQRIDGRQATYVALEDAKRKPVQLQPAAENQEPPRSPLLPDSENTSENKREQRKAPPRVRKPSRNRDECVAPTTDLGEHQRSLRETFGNTLSDEVVDDLLGKLIKGLRPGPFDTLDEATLNTALATIDSLKPDSEHLAVLAVEIVIVGSAAQRFLRMSQHGLTADFVEVYGNFALKLFRQEAELRRIYDRLKRGNTHRMEINHVHIYYGAPNVLNVANAPSAVGSKQ
jgi:hypothetical protein